MRTDEQAVSAVIATVLMALVVIVTSGTVFILVMDFRDQASEPAPHIALVTDNSGSASNQWRLSLQQAVPPRDMEEYLIFLRTPHHGTLVADLSVHPQADQLDLYWPVGSGNDEGRHTAFLGPGDLGTGGFHLRILDIDADGRLGGGDRITIWFDANGDHRHVEGPDDNWPSGTYTFELKHQRSDRFIAYDMRQF